MLRIAQEALTFDDVLLIPDHSQVMPKDVMLNTRLTIPKKVAPNSAALNNTSIGLVEMTGMVTATIFNANA